MAEQFFIYILTNWNNKVIYTGVTNNLVRRIYEHRNKVIDGFTKKYNFSHPLLADVGGSVAKKYGVFREDKGTASRKLFVMDKQGKIQKIIDGMPENNELLEFIKGLK